MKKLVAALIALAMIIAMVPAVFAVTEEGSFLLANGTNYAWTAPITGTATFSTSTGTGMIAVDEGNTAMGTASVTFNAIEGQTYQIKHFVSGGDMIEWVVEGADTSVTGGTIAIESYSNGEFTAPKDGTVQLNLDVETEMDIIIGYAYYTTVANGGTFEVEAGTTYLIYPVGLDVNATLTWEYVEGGAGGNEPGGGSTEAIPNGGELALGDNNVTLFYANRPAQAAHWTYTATEAGTLTVAVTEIDGNTMVDMAFGRGMYTLVVDEATGEYTPVASIAVEAGQTVNIAVLDTVDMTEVSAVLNLEFSAGAPAEEKDPADYFDRDPSGYYIIESLVNPVEIFVGNDDINYIYNVEFDGVLNVEYSNPSNNYIWYTVNGENLFGTAPDSVSAGDVVLLNIWNGFEGVVTLTAGGGTETPAEKNPSDYFDRDPNGYYIIESLENPVEIFVGNDDITYIYTAESAGTVTVTPSVDGYTATNCWISLNDDGWDTAAGPVDVVAGDFVLINIWSGYEGTVTLGEGSGNEGGNEPGGNEPGGETGVPSGSALVLGDNNVTLTYATMPMQAPYWTYTATEAGYLTVTVASINGNSMLSMAFGRGMYTLLAGEATGEGTNVAVVYMDAGDTLEIAVLDTIDMEPVPAVLNLAFEAGEPVVERDPADFFEQDPNGNYIIESLENPVEIFVGNDDINYIYTVEEDGVLSVEFSDPANNSIWYYVNGDCLYGIAPDSVAAGDVVIFNIWGDFAGTVTFTAGGGNTGVESAPMSGEDVAVDADESLVIYYTPTEDGVLTIDISSNPGHSVVVQNTDTLDTMGLPSQSSLAEVLTYDLEAGVEYVITLTGFSTSTWDVADATITYDITFAAGAGSSESVEIDMSTVVLDLGEQNVDLLENTIVSLFEFVPAEAGVYTITVPAGVTMAQYGFAWNLIQTAEGTTLEITATADEQTIILGFSGEVTSVNVKIEKTGSYTPPAQTVYEEYVPVDTPVEGVDVTEEDLVNIDISVEQTVVIDEDGFYHLGTVDGPLVYVNLNTNQFTLAALFDAGAPIHMHGVYTDEDGAHNYDFMNMITGDYYNYSTEYDFHPLNTDLMIFLQAYGTSQGWFKAGLSGFDVINAGEFNEDSAWLAGCYILADAEIPEGGNQGGNAETGDAGIIAAAVTMAASAIGGIAVIAKKKEF